MINIPLSPRLTLLAACFVFLAACGSAPGQSGSPQQTAQLPETRSVEQYLQLARSSAPEQAAVYRLEAAALALDRHRPEQAQTALEGVTGVNELPVELQALHALLKAELALQKNTPQAALQALGTSLFDPLSSLDEALQRQTLELWARAFTMQEQYLAAARAKVQLAPLLRSRQRPENNNQIWQILSSAPAGSLSSRDALVDSYELRGWLELLNVVNANQNNIEQQIDAINHWRERWNRHSATSQLPDSLSNLVEIWETRPRRIALLLPLQEAAGRAVNEGFMSAYYDALNQGQQVPEIRVYDTSGSSDVMFLYRSAVEQGADMVIGPLRKDAVRQLQAQRSLPVPTLALNYGDENRINPRGLYQFGLAPEDEIRQAANLAWQAGHRYAAVLTPAGEDYRRIQDSFTSYWQALGGQVISRNSFSSDGNYSDVVKQIMSIDASEARASQLRSVLPRNTLHTTPRRRQDIDFLFLLANPNEGRQIKPTLAFHYAGDVPVYSMPAIYDGGSNPIGNRDLNGITFTDAPWILGDSDPLKQTMNEIWPAASSPVQRLRAMGVDSFRLYTRVSQLESYPGTRMQGATGILSMRSDGSIQRELLSAQIVNGNARLINVSEQLESLASSN